MLEITNINVWHVFVFVFVLEGVVEDKEIVDI